MDDAVASYSVRISNHRSIFPKALIHVALGSLLPNRLDLPRFRGEVRSWDQGIWFDGILSSSFE